MTEPQERQLLLEIRFDPAEGDNYLVQARFDDPTDQAERAPARTKCNIDYKSLLTLENDAKRYGALLSSAVLSQSEIRREYDHAKTVLGSKEGDIHFLRIRLAFGVAAEKLHGLRWELLTDPADQTLISTSEKILFSRFILSQDWRAIRLRPKGEMSALIAVAAPPDLGDLRLAPIRALDEIARVRDCFQGMQVRAIGDKQPLTLDALVDELRRPTDILYLVCHGALKIEKRAQQEVFVPQLVLETSDGRAKKIDGTALAERVGELQQQPRLIVLASCESAGTTAAANLERPDVLFSLAPLLAAAGVPAIVAMRGKITIETVAEAMPAFFRELANDGQIERAMAVARGRVRERRDGWMLALFTRLKEGRIWYVPGFRGEKQDFEQWRSICRFVHNGLVVPIIGPDLASHIIGSSQELAQDLSTECLLPLSDYERADLAKVAQHMATKDSEKAARLAVKNRLIGRIEKKVDHVVGDTAQARGTVGELLSIIADEQSKNMNDPFRRLAALDVGVYVSASNVPLIEYFLRKHGKSPKSLITEWRDERQADAEFHPPPNAQTPYVYYPFGNIRHPESWVLTEDDFFDYLISMSMHNLMPDVVSDAITSNCLLFLGFGLDDWKFRVLLRIIMAKQGSTILRGYNHVGVQVHPENYTSRDIENFQEYLTLYFRSKNINVGIYWGTGVDFLNDLECQLKINQKEIIASASVASDWDYA